MTICFLDYLISKGDLKKEQREPLVEYLDFQLKDILTDYTGMTKGRLEYRWDEYRKERKQQREVLNARG